MSPDEYCRGKVARRGSSLYYSLLFLPSEKRRGLTALHAFHREISEVTRECQDSRVARAKLNWWRDETQQLFAGRPQHPVMCALYPHLDRITQPRGRFMEIIDGMEMNLDHDVYPGFQELTLHCHRVAGTLGILAAEILGYQDQATRGFASKLGVALQLLGNLRGARSDALKGRVNLPEDELQRAGVTPRDLLEPQTPERVRKLFQLQADRIRHYQRQGFEKLPEGDRYPQQSHIILANLAMALLQEIEADRFRVLEHRIALTPLRKLWLAWNTRRREERRMRLCSTENI